MKYQETERLWVNVEADEHTMRYSLFPGISGGCTKKRVQKSIIGSYKPHLLETVCPRKEKQIMGAVLRKEWGFDATTHCGEPYIQQRGPYSTVDYRNVGKPVILIYYFLRIRSSTEI